MSCAFRTVALGDPYTCPSGVVGPSSPQCTLRVLVPELDEPRPHVSTQDSSVPRNTQDLISALHAARGAPSPAAHDSSRLSAAEILRQAPACDCGCVGLVGRLLNSGVDLRLSAPGRFSDDAGVTVERVTASTLCPLTRRVLVVPARMPGCCHLQAFDAVAATHLAQVVRNRKRIEAAEASLSAAHDELWSAPLRIVCPLCSSAGPAETQRIDWPLLTLLQSLDPSVRPDTMAVALAAGSDAPILVPVRRADHADDAELVE